MSKAKKGLRLSRVKTFPHLSRKQQLNFLLPQNLNSFIIFSFRELSNQSCEWFYNNVKKKFKRFGSAKVVRSLYKRKSECKYYVFTPSFIHRLNHLFLLSFIPSFSNNGHLVWNQKHCTEIPKLLLAKGFAIH